VGATGVAIRPVSELGSVTYRLLTRRGAALSAPAAALVTAIRAIE
jgi:hypothetical protein